MSSLVHTARIVRRFRASPTVIVLDLCAPTLTTFHPGQWIDFMAPPYTWVGGFSLVSSPRDLPTVSVAVKRSTHPPAAWVHSQEAEETNREVKIRVGGTCTLLPMEENDDSDDDHPSRTAVFCAGGIGISPILSQYREFLRLRDKTKTDNDDVGEVSAASTMFLYSVSSPDDFIFVEELGALSKPGSQTGQDRMVFALTQTNDWGGEAVIKEFPHIERRQGRILTDFLDQAPPGSRFYVCGPPSMIDDAVDHLEKRGIPQDCIQYEKWW